jgi:hypothetical protein
MIMCRRVLWRQLVHLAAVVLGGGVDADAGAASLASRSGTPRLRGRRHSDLELLKLQMQAGMRAEAAAAAGAAAGSGRATFEQMRRAMPDLQLEVPPAPQLGVAPGADAGAESVAASALMSRRSRSPRDPPHVKPSVFDFTFPSAAAPAGMRSESGIQADAVELDRLRRVDAVALERFIAAAFEERGTKDAHQLSPSTAGPTLAGVRDRGHARSLSEALQPPDIRLLPTPRARRPGPGPDAPQLLDALPTVIDSAPSLAGAAATEEGDVSPVASASAFAGATGIRRRPSPRRPMRPRPRPIPDRDGPLPLLASRGPGPRRVEQ